SQHAVFMDEVPHAATLPTGTPGTTPSLTVVNPDAQFDVRLRGFLYDFSDVPAGALYHDDVRTLALAGVTAGCDEGRFCPSTPITRAQTAILMEKTLHGLDFEYPAAGGVFLDVDRCSPAATYIYEFL